MVMVLSHGDGIEWVWHLSLLDHDCHSGLLDRRDAATGKGKLARQHLHLSTYTQEKVPRQWISRDFHPLLGTLMTRACGSRTIDRRHAWTFTSTSQPPKIIHM